MDHLGIDVHKKESQICILAEGGELIERRVRTEARRFAVMLGDRPPARIVIEASTDSEWVARCLEGLGHEVIAADPNSAPMYGTRHRKVMAWRWRCGPKAVCSSANFLVFIAPVLLPRGWPPGPWPAA